MKTSMLEYGKVILQKVAFSRYLFRKEYKKFRILLPEHEGVALREWTRQHIIPK